ncbi:hypothetical protein AAJ76_1000072446 [Vairimorpha ceranae]|nr:hypothetical protein AAJ76_1000072446 [Vairimorpha ceranae]KKO75894.1 hypothetical protein AAJ76_1000072446 [Vairimorpha ceranae]
MPKASNKSKIVPNWPHPFQPVKTKHSPRNYMESIEYPKYYPINKKQDKVNKIPPEPVNKPHFLIYQLNKNTDEVDEDYKKRPYASTAADLIIDKVDDNENDFDKNFYHDHLPPAPYTYDGSVVAHSALM